MEHKKTFRQREQLYAGLHKIEIGLGTKFLDKFSAWFSRNFMLSGKAQNVHFILSNIYIGLKNE